MKKTYIAPVVKEVKIQATEILAASTPDNLRIKDDVTIDDENDYDWTIN